jgi:hypothetical protein
VPIQHTLVTDACERFAMFGRNLSTVRRRSPGTAFANTHDVTVLGGLLLVTSGVAVSLGLSRLALGEFFRLVRIDTTDRTPARPQDSAR